MREGWKVVKFGEVVEFPPKIKMVKGNKYPFIPMELIDGGYKYVKPIEEKELAGGGAKFEEGDTLFARITPCLQNGKIAQAKNLNNKPGFGSTEYFIFRGIPNVTDNDYVYYLSQMQEFRDNAINSMVGASGRQRADSGHVKSFEFNLPPLETQKKIASILSGYDDLIENNLKRIKILEEMAQQTYEEWFVRMRFPGHESIAINKETGLPEGWEKMKLGDVSIFKYGSMPKKDDIVESGYPVYSGYRITGFSKKFNISKKSLIVVARGVGGTGDVKLSPEKCWLTNLSILVNLNNNENINYLYYYLKAANLRSLDSGAAQSQITIISLETFPIVLPKIELIKRFNEIIEPIFDTIDNLQNQNQRLREARDILLPRLMMGMIDTSTSSVQVMEKLDEHH